MKRLISLFSLFLLVTGTALAAERQVLDQVVAVVNSDVITQSELDMLLRPLYEDYKKQYSEMEVLQKINEARSKLLSQLIEDRLVFQEAKKQNIEAGEEEVRLQMEEFKKKFKSDSQMEDALKKEGLSFKSLKERLEKQSIVRQVQDREIRSKVVVSPGEVEAYFNSHPGEFSLQAKLRLRTLTVKKSDEARQKGLTDETAKAKMQTLRTKILAGGDFAALAKENSEDTSAKEGGLVGWVERGNMIPVIDEVIFKMKAGEVSEIIETEIGYHLFRVEEREEAKKATLDQARDAIAGKIFRQKAEERFKTWLSELKKDAYISLR